MIHMITGGARSGKSRYAQEQALSRSNQPVYVATAQVWDDDFAARIQRHQAERGSAWINYEETLYVSHLPLDGHTVVIDCITLWLTNFFVHHQYDIDLSLAAITAEIHALQQKAGTFIIVTNEIGMGVHAETAAGRKFTDLQGWVNQYLARVADTVVLMVSGIPMVIKQP
ncbi:bifunctional adenosylcobinamide kinase/adenosylcobinamide-phosphate guanylyltransferase [Chitinophaga nivalis]|uniref:Adenosylcobinamide kinase n=1 Tax=Chitinophaga nivalis TaxID=2991709 RepID=A0ABT3IWB7_9BACT|nr:bifunctional adenosylcobinamide kinase/adenosylcobinamide-phosphate guanylyltransferase [Chitinophaga nivalis]MCW3462043.1 bifunctional adenosylcobinamide kinase/adenosylcobinamide-phosphate guanylyltransferase [Chitinophaga nivalis]MCW3488265.1 bifunctional adenosylcobinamide kinase/adenosylcobinamide-phosphate guanylyltransferase [Chitinophaga nivalis]